MYKVPLNTATYDEREINAAKEVLDSGQLTMGKRCEEFEEAFGRYQSGGSKDGNQLFCNSGSSANLLAFGALQQHISRDSALDFSFKGEIIVPALTWSTTVWPIIQCGFRPVFVDSDPETLQVLPSAIEAAITDKTVAICIVHILGGACNMDAISRIASTHGLPIIEDCCESLGTTYKGRKVGTFGRLSTFSFFFSHHITTIEGGMVCSRDGDDDEIARSLRSHGWIRHSKRTQDWGHTGIDKRFLFTTLGYNLRPTEINAAFGNEQIKVLDELNAKRRAIADIWRVHLGSIGAKIKPMKLEAFVTPAPMGFPVMCENGAQRRALQMHLEGLGIETRPIIAGNLTKHPALSDEALVQLPHRISGELTGADKVSHCGLFWGCSPFMPDEHVAYVCSALEDFKKKQG